MISEGLLKGTEKKKTVWYTPASFGKGPNRFDAFQTPAWGEKKLYDYKNDFILRCFILRCHDMEEKGFESQYFTIVDETTGDSHATHRERKSWIKKQSK